MKWFLGLFVWWFVIYWKRKELEYSSKIIVPRVQYILFMSQHKKKTIEYMCYRAWLVPVTIMWGYLENEFCFIYCEYRCSHAVAHAQWYYDSLLCYRILWTILLFITFVVHHFWYTRKCPLHLKFGLWFISRILETGKQLNLYQICRIYGEEAMSDEMSWRGMWLFNEGCKNMYIDELTIFKEWWCSACSWKKIMKNSHYGINLPAFFRHTCSLRKIVSITLNCCKLYG